MRQKTAKKGGADWLALSRRTPLILQVGTLFPGVAVPAPITPITAIERCRRYSGADAGHDEFSGVRWNQDPDKPDESRNPWSLPIHSYLLQYLRALTGSDIK